jgi:hypothetical protein
MQASPGRAQMPQLWLLHSTHACIVQAIPGGVQIPHDGLQQVVPAAQTLGPPVVLGGVEVSYAAGWKFWGVTGYGGKGERTWMDWKVMERERMMGKRRP